MPAEKIKRLIVSSVVTAVLLLFILLSIMVYQMIAIKNTRRQIDTLNKEISELEAEKEQTEDKIELWLSDWKIEERQRELGWVYEQDK